MVTFLCQFELLRRLQLLRKKPLSVYTLRLFGVIETAGHRDQAARRHYYNMTWMEYITASYQARSLKMWPARVLSFMW